MDAACTGSHDVKSTDKQIYGNQLECRNVKKITDGDKRCITDGALFYAIHCKDPLQEHLHSASKYKKIDSVSTS